MKEDARDENFVRRVIEALPDNADGVALDIGANHGLYTDMLARKFDYVYAFEPDPNNMKILQGRSKAPNVSFVEEAVGVSGEEVVKLYRSDDPGGSSTNEESPRFGGWGHRWDNYIWVPTITLDRFWKDHYWSHSPEAAPICFIKCDVEGAEDYIFEHGKLLLSENKLQIVLECHQPVNFVRLYALFDSLKYKVFDMNGDRVRALRRDCHFLIRNDL